MLYSFSRLTLYETCPYRFRRKYIDGVEEPVTKPLALGKAVHKAIESLINGKSMEQALIDGWVEANFHPEVAQREMKKLLQHVPIRQGMGEAEVFFRLPLANASSAPELRGYIDVIDGDTIVDWKSNWKMYDVRDTHQVGLYSWALQQLREIQVVKGRLYFLRFKKPSQHIFTSLDMEKARQWALNLAMEIKHKLFLLEVAAEKQDSLFPATPSSACSHCPVVLECYHKFGEVVPNGNRPSRQIVC